MTDPRTRVLVVDDSPFVRKVIREVLTAGGLDVVDIARDGLEALEKVERLRPDVVTLDLMMPHLDGLSVLDQLATREARPAVVVVTISGADTEAGLEALERGAVAVVEKPTALATQRLYEMELALVSAVRAAAAARPRLDDLRCEKGAPVERAPRSVSPAVAALVVVGTSTGGPQALTRLIPALPAGLPVPMAVALHIPPGYTELLAKRLDEASEVRVVEASEGLVLEPGTVVIARAGMHLSIARGREWPIAHVGFDPLDRPHHPSVDVLFETAAEAYGRGVLGVVLTGMGSDGLAGARAIRRHGGRVVTEAESSAIVYGMPRAVHEAGLADLEAPLSQMVEAILEQIGPQAPTIGSSAR
jgi:two-component system chemotaxis response regulator CheB